MANIVRARCPGWMSAPKARRFVGSWVVILVASCSLRNLDELDSGRGGEGGSDNASGSSSKGGGVTGVTAGTGNMTPNAGGGVTYTASGGTTAELGTTAPAGGVSAGGQAATTPGSVVPSTCPAASTLSGKEVYAFGFETGRGGWEKVAGASGTVLNDGSACEGEFYFSLDGAMRQGDWDGPAFNFFAYATAGNSYYFSAAVRFNRSNPLTVGRRVQATVAIYCSDKTEAIFAPLSYVTVANEWVRLETVAVPFVYKVSTACGTVTKLVVYLETPDAEDASLSVDVDDVHIWETVGSAGTGGAGGGGGVAGAAGSAGMAGAGGNAGAGGS